jgi:large subunit ribosomal protein L13
MKVIDAKGLIVGRMASKIAKMLLEGEDVVILNSEKALLTGSKVSVYKSYKKKRELVHRRKGPFYPRMPDQIVKRSIRGMLPYQKPRGRTAFKNLKVYIGVPKEFQKTKMQTIKEAQLKGSSKYVEVGEISIKLGSNYRVVE